MRLRQTTWPQIQAHHQFIVDMLAAGVTQQTIWQRLRDEHGLSASVASLKRYVAANLPEDVLRSKVTVLRETPPAGEEAQIDYGYLGTWLDPVGGRLRRVWAFVIVLACSRHLFVRPVLTMDQAAWTQAHVEAFAFFAGVPARLVPDNLRTGVERSDLYDPKMNRSYAELAAHYDTLIDPARSGNPKTKPAWNGRCPMSATRSGVAVSSPRSRRCSSPRSSGAPMSPGNARADRWAVPHR